MNFQADEHSVANMACYQIVVLLVKWQLHPCICMYSTSSASAFHSSDLPPLAVLWRRCSLHCIMC
jgi:hypothetical protein